MLKREQYVFVVRRPYPPLFLDMMLRGMANPDYYKQLVDEPCPISDGFRIDADFYYALPDLDRASKVVFRDWMDPKKMARAKAILNKREKKLLGAAKKDFASFQEAYEQYSPAVLLPFRAEGPVAKKMRELLGKKCSPQKVDELMDILNVPVVNNIHKQEEYDLLKASDLRAHVKKYEWLKSRFGAIEPYTVAEAKDKLKSINKAEFLRDYFKEKRQIRASIKEAKSLLGKEQSHLVDFMQYIVYYRTHRTDILNRAQYLFIPCLKKMAKKRGLSYEQLLHCTCNEVVGNAPSFGVLAEREKHLVYILENGQGRIATSQEGAKARAFLSEDVTNTTEARGAIAFKGKISGTVRLIFSANDFSKIKIGDILVASMTNPHMIPIMKKAAAFVTDEGGITCHAAILAREMKKPCVIGTKIATKIFKDGDRVEVDAEKGIVRKI